MILASVADFRAAAKRRLPRFLFEYIDGGSYAEVTLKRNIADLEAVALRQLVLRDFADMDLSTELFGQMAALPVALGPVGLAGMYARRGERQAARAAESAGVPFTLSTMAACGLAEVAKATTKPFWFQLYATKDRDFLRGMLAQARGLGCPVLVFTVDLPIPGTRYRDQHTGLSGAQTWRTSLKRFAQAATRPGWAWDVGIHGRPHTIGNVAPLMPPGAGIADFLGWSRDNFDHTLTWDTIGFIREQWPGPIVLKGILDPEDARRAVDLGVEGIVVSNHGGRQLDGVLSSARALPAIADAVGGQTTILADSGVRSGLDVVRMLALGADAVMLGRAWAYALAADGEAGVRRMLELIEAEMRVAMALTGVTRISQIDKTCLAGEYR